MSKLFSPKPIMQDGGIAAIRIITGIFLLYHGLEVFDADKIKEYAAWDMFKISSHPVLMPYIGKTAELVAGCMLLLGLLTRIACVIIAGTMLYITFIIGHGKVWYDDQHPFLFVLLAAMFFFTGPGCLSIDGMLFNKKQA